MTYCPMAGEDLGFRKRVVQPWSNWKWVGEARRSLSDAESVAGEECEKTFNNPLSLRGKEEGLGTSPQILFNIWVLFLQSSHSSALFQGKDFPPNLKKKLNKLMNRLLTNNPVVSHWRKRRLRNRRHREEACWAWSCVLRVGNPHVHPCWQEDPILL